MLLRSLPCLLFVPALFAQERTAVAVEPLAPAVADAIATEGIQHSQVMRLLRDLTGKIGHRLTGSDNFAKGCEWAKGEFEKMGLQVELEQWGEWKVGWNRGAWVGRITSPFRYDMYVATEAWTAGTNGMQAGAVVIEPDWSVETLPRCDGKWVLSKIHTVNGADGKRLSRRERDTLRALQAKRVGEAGALGLVYRAEDPDKDFPTRVRVFGMHQTAMLPLADVPKTPEIAVRADNYDVVLGLVEGGKTLTCEFDIQNTWREGPIVLNNVIATLRGTGKPDEMVVVSSHFDSWHQAQGTTDNGTGSTTTMEAARILTAVGARPQRTIKFCLWGGEEEGLLGSDGWVKRHRAEMPKVSAAFNHDTGTNWAQSMAVTQPMHDQLAPIFEQVNRVLKAPDADWTGPVFALRVVGQISGGGGSDHASFISALVPGLNWGLKGRSNYFAHTWHTQWDTIDVAIEEYQRHTATVIAMAALGTANLPALLDRANVVPGGGDRGGGTQAIAMAAGWFGAELDESFTFKSVKEDGRAAKMGVQKGDVLKKVNGQAVERARQIFQFAREATGDTVTFTLQRGDQTIDAKMQKDDLPPRRGDGARDGQQGTSPPPVQPPIQPRGEAPGGTGTGSGTSTGSGGTNGGTPPPRDAGGMEILVASAS